MNEAPPIDASTEVQAEVAADDGFHQGKTPLELGDPNIGSDQDIHSEKKFVDLDSVVVVKSGINADGQEDVLPAVKAFLKHPARALSERELAIIMEIDDAEDALDALIDEGVVVLTNELDGEQFRYRLI